MAGQDGAAPPPQGWEPRLEKPLPSHLRCPSIMGKIFGERGWGLHLYRQGVGGEAEVESPPQEAAS